MRLQADASIIKVFDAKIRKEGLSRVYQILKKQTLNANTKLMVIDAPHVARKAEPGQFIILRVSEEGERIPLTIADFDRETGAVTIIFQEVGATTMALGRNERGRLPA